MQYLYIFVGGAVGALLRYFFSFMSVNSTIPTGTFIANILGAFLMGFLGTLTLQYYKNNPHLKKGITTGLLGAMTTFSTFQFELIHLFEQQAYLAVTIYAISSYVLGICLCYIGVRSGARIS